MRRQTFKIVIVQGMRRQTFKIVIVQGMRRQTFKIVIVQCMWREQQILVGGVNREGENYIF